MNLAVNGMAGAVSALPDSISARALAGCWGIARCPFGDVMRVVSYLCSARCGPSNGLI